MGRPGYLVQKREHGEPSYACGKRLSSFSARSGAPCKAAAPLEILGVDGVVGISLSSDLDMAFNHCLADAVQCQHPAWTRAGGEPDGESPVACGAEVFALQPTTGFVRVGSPCPAQQLILNDMVHYPEGSI